jgi:hypothetical protein
VCAQHLTSYLSYPARTAEGLQPAGTLQLALTQAGLGLGATERACCPSASMGCVQLHSAQHWLPALLYSFAPRVCSTLAEGYIIVIIVGAIFTDRASQGRRKRGATNAKHTAKRYMQQLSSRRCHQFKGGTIQPQCWVTHMHVAGLSSQHHLQCEPHCEPHCEPQCEPRYKPQCEPSTYPSVTSR